MKCTMCERPAQVKGFCRTHYRYNQIRERENTLKDIINETDKLRERKPELAGALDEIKSLMQAKSLFREFQEKKLSPAEKIKKLESEVEMLKALNAKSMRTMVKAPIRRKPEKIK